MGQNAEVVVIIPTIGGDPWLSEAVESLLCQRSLGLRIIVAHDGASPDDSLPWLGDPRVDTVESATRIGLAGILALAMETVSEEFVGRLDADDIASPNRFRAQIDYLRAHPNTLLVGSRASRIDEQGRSTGSLLPATGDDVRLAMIKRNPIIHSSALFRTDAYFAAGGYDPMLRQMEDYDLWLRMAVDGEVAVLADELVSYRVHGGQMSRGAKPYSLYARRVWSGQGHLAKVLGINPVASLVSRTAWSVAQYLRYFGLRKPGHSV
ncbi:glycosyltransferase [Leifsonia sp. YIM 134122]|uniref:Glycosyltransferase n=1 Tax=Leifsonia stereocauli TaxID=3134136 RepID=A0ABU9W702_9MICO